ncbi:MAG: type I CRISPR-associated protein Cas7 [Candidatus Micrarchaeia archaeon]
MSERRYGKFAAGIVSLRAQDANWNADFSGWPRKLPGGGFYSTDKALKYTIRRYLKEVKNQNLIFWRVYDEKGQVGNLLAMLEKNKIKTDTNIAKQVLEKCLDVRLFGGTFTLKNQQFSITGPVQITYGIDVWGKGKPYVSQIQSPKYEGKERGEESKAEYGPQTTLGSEVRLTEGHYVFDFTINPNNLEKDDFLASSAPEVFLSNDDVEMFKEALIHGPGYTTSTTKTGVFTELVIFAEFEIEDGFVPLVPILRDGVSVQKSNGDNLKRKIDIRRVVGVLKELGANRIELYFRPDLCEIEYDKEDGIMEVEIKP